MTAPTTFRRARRRGAREWGADVATGALALLRTTLFFIILDSSVVIVAIPSMENDLAMTPDMAQLGDQRLRGDLRGVLIFAGRLADVRVTSVSRLILRRAAVADRAAERGLSP